MKTYEQQNCPPVSEERGYSRRQFFKKTFVSAGAIAGVTLGGAFPELVHAQEVVRRRGYKLAPFYRLYNSHSRHHFYTTDVEERDRAREAGYSYEGIACYVWSADGQRPSFTVKLYRLYNSKNDDHFYTTSVDERDKAVASYGYTYEGVAAYVFKRHEADPFYRLYNPDTGDHFYTRDKSERNRAVADYGYTYEGIACYVV